MVYRSKPGEAPTSANGMLYLRDRGQLEPTPLRGTEDAVAPFFSPDGEWIAFSTGTDNTLKRVSVLGGPTQTICAYDGLLRGASWGPDNTIVFATNNGTGLRRVAAAGGEPQVLTKLDGTKGETGHYWPEVLPGGQGVLFTAWTGSTERPRIAVVSLSDGHVSTLVTGGTSPRFALTGQLVFAVDGTLRAVRFDPTHLAVIGNPVPVVEGVAMTSAGGASYALSSTGSLVYVPGPVTSTTAGQLSLGWFNRTGATELLKMPPGAYQLPRLSPDGKRLAFGSDDGKDATIWIYDLSGASAVRRLTFDGQGHNRFPVWSADSQRVTFQSDREKDLGIFWQRADGSGTAERLAKAEEGTSYIPEAWSPDGARLLYNATGKDSMSALWTWSLKDRKAERFGAVVSPAGTLTGAVFSPDGQWVAYASREGSRTRSAVYVQPFPPTGAKYQISKNENDGHHPMWSRDGKELLFTPGPVARLYVVSVSTQPAFSFGEAVVLARPFVNAAPSLERPFDISRDGQRFLGLIDAAQAAQSGKPEPPQIRVVTNWFEELKAKVPTKEPVD